MGKYFPHIQHETLRKTELMTIINKLEKCETSDYVNKHKTVNEIIEALRNVTQAHIEISCHDILCCIDWLTSLELLQHIKLNNCQLRILFDIVCVLLKKKFNEEIDVCLALKVLKKLITPCDTCILNTHFILELIQENDDSLLSLVDYVNNKRPLEEITTILQSFIVILETLSGFDKLNISQTNLCNILGEKILNLFFSNLNAGKKCITDFYLSGFEILTRITAMQKEFSVMHASELFGITKSFLTFGVEKKFTVPIPELVNISQQFTYNSLEDLDSIADSDYFYNNNGKKSSKSHKLRAIEKSTNDRNNCFYRNLALPNEENIKINDVMKSIESTLTSSVRLMSIELMGMVCRNLTRRLLYGYWDSLFPSNVCDKSKNHLLYVSQNDPNIRCRISALHLCSQVLYGSRRFLLQAEFNEKLCPTAFVPFSINLGLIVKTMYKHLLTIITTEGSVAVLIQALKCLAILVQATTSEKIEKIFIQSVANDIKPFVYHRDAAIQVSALMIMEFIVTSLKLTNDVVEVLGLFEDIDKTSITNAKITMNWLLCRVCYNLDQQNNVPSTVRIESLQVLKGLTNHVYLLASHLLVISELLQKCLNDRKSDVRLYSGRCIEAITFQIDCNVMDKKEDGQIKNDELVISQYDDFWLLIVDKIINHINQNVKELVTIKICLIDALSNIGCVMFERLKYSMRIKLITFLTGLSSETLEDSVVRATCIRALAVYASFSLLNNDLVFMENTLRLTLDLIKDSNVAVRIKTFWSLGNISDVLVKNNSTEKLLQDPNSNELLYCLIDASTKACNDCDKIRCNAVRILGNLLRLLKDHHFTTILTTTTKNINWYQTFENAVTKLSDCIRLSSNAKVKWNTCYALSNLFKNHIIYKINGSAWKDILYPTVCHILTNHSNFKVRTNASIAIINIEQRDYFGKYFESFWSSLLQALEQTNNLNNYLEYNHRDALQEQLCIAISHLLHCSRDDDFIMLKSQLTNYADTIRTIWLRVIGHMVPEKAEKLLQCSVSLKKRCDSFEDTFNNEQKKSAIFLLKYFQIEPF